MEKISVKGSGFFKFLKKLLVVLLAISALMLTVCIVSMITTQNSIKNNLSGIIQQVEANTGAKSVDVDIYAESGNYFRIVPVEYHVFLTANCDNLRGKTEDQWVTALLGGQKPHAEYGYSNDENAIYSMSINISGREHPIFVSVTDGENSYSLYCENTYYDNPTIEKRDAKVALHPSKLGFTINIYIFATVAFLAGLILLIYRDMNQKKRIKEQSIKYYSDCIKKGVDIDDPEQKFEVFELGKTYAAECNIDKFDGCYKDFYLLGKATYEKAVGKSNKSPKSNSRESTVDSFLEDIDVEIGLNQINQSKKKKMKILVASVVSIVIIAVVATAVVKLIVIPTNRYNEAVSLKNVGEDEAAYQIFKELGNFKDSKQICNQYDYDNALAYLSEGKYAKAYQLLVSIEKLEEADAKAKEILNDRPYLSILSSEVGDEVKFGSYEQGNGIEEIDWYVLAKENGNVLLISKYMLDAQPFNTVNTKDCTLDDWLKKDFYNNAFGDIDEKIIDVTLLDQDDATQYMTSEQKKCDPTAYAKSKDGFRKGYQGNYYYWLSGHVYSSSGKAGARVARDSGMISNDGSEVTDINGVRPAVWICPNGEEDFPAEYVYSGETPVKYSPGGSGGSSGSGKCSYCNGTGKKLVTWYSEGDWGETSYSSYKCPQCNGTGRK